MSKNLTIKEENQQLKIKYKSKNNIFKFWRKNLVRMSYFLFLSPFLLSLLLLIVDSFIPLNELINPNLFNPFFSIKICVVLSISTLAVAEYFNKMPDPEYPYTITLKVNKNFITVEHQYNEQKRPIKQTFNSKSIKRISLLRDVKVFVSKKGKHCNMYSYQIWIEKNEGQRIKILSEYEIFGKQVRNARSIMEASKDFLHQKLLLLSQDASSIIQNVPRRKIIKEQDISKLKIKDLKKGYLLDYKLETWEVIGEVQYDWRQGSTDMIYQLKNKDNKTLLLSVCQDMAIYSTWIEEYLTYHGSVIHKLDKIPYQTPLEFTFKGKIFFKEHVDLGYGYVADTDKGVDIKQWKYLCGDEKYSLRILKHEDEDILMFSGKKVENFEFSNILIP